MNNMVITSLGHLLTHYYKLTMLYLISKSLHTVMNSALLLLRFM